MKLEDLMSEVVVVSIVAEELADEILVSDGVAPAIPASIDSVAAVNSLLSSNTRLFSPAIPVKLTFPDAYVLEPLAISVSLNFVASVARRFVIVPVSDESLPPIDERKQPPVGQDLFSLRLPISFNLSNDDAFPFVPGDELTLTLAPNVVLEPTSSDEDPPTEAFLLTVEPLID